MASPELDLEQFLLENVPLTKAMGLRVERVSDDSLTLSAPFAANRNQHNTVFGGSSSTLCTLAAWGLVYTRLEQSGLKTKLVAKSSHVHYLAPLTGDFEVIAEFETREEWSTFVAALQTSGKGNIQVRALAYQAKKRELVGTSLVGRFSALVVV